MIERQKLRIGGLENWIEEYENWIEEYENWIEEYENWIEEYEVNKPKINCEGLNLPCS